MNEIFGCGKCYNRASRGLEFAVMVWEVQFSTQIFNRIINKKNNREVTADNGLTIIKTTLTLDLCDKIMMQNETDPYRIAID